MKRIITATVLVTLMIFPAQARLKLSSTVADHMVVRRNSTVQVWGWADPGAKVRVSPSWTKTVSKSVAAEDGLWTASIETPEAGGPYSISFRSGKDKCQVEDVLSGDVWICAGQSNMQMALVGNNNQPVRGAAEEMVSLAQYRDRIRFFHTEISGSDTLCTETRQGRWDQCGPESWQTIRAIPYYFAKHLTENLQIPIGIINVNWGSAKIESFMDEETARSVEGLDINTFNDDKKIVQHKLYTIYNAMVHPISRYGVTGTIWYQGESNLDDPALYRREFKAFVNMWRKVWNNPDMPFYYAQIAPFPYGDPDADLVPRFVEQQVASTEDLDHLGMIGLTDIGDRWCIHPSTKAAAGFRFAFMALSRHYGFDFGVGKTLGPTLSKAEINKKDVFVTFTDALKGLQAGDAHRVTGFELAGSDGTFYPAEAVIVGNKPLVRVWSEKVSVPAFIRYAWHNIPDGNLSDCLGFPAIPFCHTL